jgi:ABC-type uncharacterized transport system ATPase subunit
MALPAIEIVEPGPDPEGTESWAIRTHHLTKRYGELYAIRDLDLSVRPGEIFGLIGPNGAGKRRSRSWPRS